MTKILAMISIAIFSIFGIVYQGYFEESLSFTLFRVYTMVIGTIVVIVSIANFIKKYNSQTLSRNKKILSLSFIIASTVLFIFASFGWLFLLSLIYATMAIILLIIESILERKGFLWN